MEGVIRWLFLVVALVLAGCGHPPCETIITDYKEGLVQEMKRDTQRMAHEIDRSKPLPLPYCRD